MSTRISRARSTRHSRMQPRARWLLVAVFIGEVLSLKWIGAQLKHARQHGSLDWERAFRQHVEHQTQPFRSQMQALSQLNRGLTVIDLLLWCLLRASKGRDAARCFALAVGGVAILRRVVKLWVHRPRPALWDKLRPTQTTSFPSGHAANTMAPLAALTWLTWPTPWRSMVLLLGAPLVFLIGLSRIALDKHYPSDILAGWATALVWVAGVTGYERLQTR